MPHLASEASHRSGNRLSGGRTGPSRAILYGMDTTLTPDPAWRVALRPPITARGWTSLTHNLLGLPLGTADFIGS